MTKFSAKFKWLKIMSVILLTVPLLSGCWDQLSIEQRATVLGLAVDIQDTQSQQDAEGDVSNLGDKQSPPPRVFELTAHIAVPGRIPLGPGEGDGAQQRKSLWILHVTGQTMEAAILNLQQQVADRLFFGHLRIIVISQKVAKMGIREMSDYFRRNPEVRRSAWMVVSEGRAEGIMKTAPPLERVPTLYLQSGLDHAEAMGKLPNLTMGRFWSVLASPAQEPVLPYLRIKGQGNIETAGIALFRGDKMIAHTTPSQIPVFMEVRNINPAGYGALTPVPGTDGHVMFSAIHRRTRIRLEMNHGVPHFTVRVHVDGNITETYPADAINLTPEMLNKVNQVEADLLQEEDMKFIHQTQQIHADRNNASRRSRMPPGIEVSLASSSVGHMILRISPVPNSNG